MTTKMEQMFVRVISIINDAKIDYWVTDGTLLGLIRDGKLIPWDTDIDLAVIKTQQTKTEIVELFVKNGFQYKQYLPDMDCLHFSRDGVNLDINLYSINDEFFHSKWVVYPKNFLKKNMLRFVSRMFEVSRNKEISSSGPIVRFAFICFGIIIPKPLENWIYRISKTQFVYVGSFFPVEMMRFSKRNFYGVYAPVPIETESYIEMIYGKSWKSPDKSFDWTTQTSNLKEL